MEIVYNDDDLMHYMHTAVSVSNDSPVLLDRFLFFVIEIDVDAICDGKEVFVGGIMQHIEQAGIHSGDSACSLPPHSLTVEMQARLKEITSKLAFGLNVVGLMNIQYAVKGDDVYLLEVNPRASRTVPFVSKATGIPLAKVAARCMAGQTLQQQGVKEEVNPDHFSVKESVFPFIKFSGVDPILGPEMKSTGEVMGVGKTFGEAFAKSQLAAGVNLPLTGRALISVRDVDKAEAANLVKELIELGFEIFATDGTANFLDTKNIPCKHVNKVRQGRPHIVDMIIDKKIDLIVNTTEGKQAIADSYTMRREALKQNICYTTTITGAWALKQAIEQEESSDVYQLQDLHAQLH